VLPIPAPARQAGCAAARFISVRLGGRGRYDFALESLKQIPYARWRDYHTEDTIQFYALRLPEAGMIKSTPNKIITQGMDWHFWNELKRELKS
jgi:NitT/TauT family transport system substrate-binding protein